MSNAKETTNIKWHPAFCSATEFEFRKNKDVLQFLREYQLSKEPLAMDLLIVEKLANVVLENEIGKIFRRYNVIEYKSPDDSLNIDDFYKTIGYAALFKGTASKVNFYAYNEITVSLFVETVPQKLMQQLSSMGMVLEEKFSGIFYVYGNTLFPTQIIVTDKMDSQHHAALKVLSKNVQIEDVRLFLAEAEADVESLQHDNIDSVLQASVSANKDVYEMVRRDNPMCEALRELMKDDIEAAEARGEARGILATISAYREFALDNKTIITKIMDKFHLTEEQAKAFVLS